MDSSIPFVYRDFYDVPRMIVIRVGRRQILLDSRFSPDLDDYTDYYEVSELPPELDVLSLADWSDLPERSLKVLGRLPVIQLRFDPSRRKTLDGGCIEPLLSD